MRSYSRSTERSRSSRRQIFSRMRRPSPNLISFRLPISLIKRITRSLADTRAGLCAGEDFPMLERTLTLLAAATGLRISECLGLQWQDLDFPNQKIHVRRTWLDGQIGKPKTKASSQPVAMGRYWLTSCVTGRRNSIFQTTGLGLSLIQAPWPETAHGFHHGAGLFASGGG